MHCIYAIENRANGKMYIGSTIKKDVRWRAHKSDLRRGKHHSIALQRAWDKYGEENFNFYVLEEVEDSSMIIEREQEYLDTLNPDYNICKVAGNCMGRKFSKESRQKMSRSHQGKKLSLETRRKMSKAKTGSGNSFYGNTHSEYTKRKISKSLMGNVPSNRKRVVRTCIKTGESKEYDAIGFVEEDGFYRGSVRRCCNGKASSYKGYIWRFAEEKSDNS